MFLETWIMMGKLNEGIIPFFQLESYKTINIQKPTCWLFKFWHISKNVVLYTQDNTVPYSPHSSDKVRPASDKVWLAPKHPTIKDNVWFFYGLLWQEPIFGDP